MLLLVLALLDLLLQLHYLVLEDLCAAPQMRVRELSHGILLVLRLLLGLLGHLVAELCARSIQILQLSSRLLILLEGSLNARLQLGILRAVLMVRPVFNHANLGLGLQGRADGGRLLWRDTFLIMLLLTILNGLWIMIHLLMSRCLHVLLLLHYLFLVSKLLRRLSVVCLGR